MHSQSGLAATAALLAASFVVGAPVSEYAEIQRSANAFTVHQIHNPGYKGFHASGPAALAKAYTKYNAAMPADLVKAVAAGTGTGLKHARP
jgi:hypothetical protein